MTLHVDLDRHLLYLGDVTLVLDDEVARVANVLNEDRLPQSYDDTALDRFIVPIQ